MRVPCKIYYFMDNAKKRMGELSGRPLVVNANTGKLLHLLVFVVYSFQGIAIPWDCLPDR